jgi:prepilin-type N-terminal cleavage/methylation domain-containing protein
MDCTIISSIRKKARCQGMTLVEMMIATAVTSIVVSAVLSVAFYTARSFAAMTNYVDLDANSRKTLDTMTTEIRQADKLTYASDNVLRFQTSDPTTLATHTLQYTYDSGAKTLKRTFDGQDTVLLTQCTFWTNSLCQRNATNASFGSAFQAIPTTSWAQCKVIQLTWVCARNILGRAANTESVQSAHVVIRKK